MSNSITQINKKIENACQLKDIVIDFIDEPNNKLFTDILIEKKYITPESANMILQDVTNTESLNPTKINFTTRFIQHINRLFSKDILIEHNVFPVKHEHNIMHMVMSLPDNIKTIKIFEAVSGSRIKPYCCYTSAIQQAINKHFKNNETKKSDVNTLIEEATKSVSKLLISEADIMEIINHSSVINLLQSIFNTILTLNTSDIHFEPQENSFLIRFRENGVMRKALTLPSILKDAIIPRIKLISGMNIKITHSPQDTSISYGLVKGRDLDIRVSSLPVTYGEKMVLRILDKGKVQVKVNELGMDEYNFNIFEKEIRRPHGMILVTGPTGSGKTTTLYAAINELNSTQVNIVTAEDPVEYKINGINQVECGEKLTYHDALKSFLRQDPDIIMVGEIRDIETADIALKAAMTGHLVLSTLHTNDAPSALSRLIQMGLPPYLIVSAEPVIIAQRLLRKICSNCKTKDITFNINTSETIKCYKGKGCDKCFGTGYNGRIGIYEIFSLSNKLTQLVLNNEPASTLKNAAIKEGMITLKESALQKLRQGITTIQEFQRITTI